MVSAKPLLFLVVVLLVAPALAAGQVYTIDQGQPLNAEAAKHPVLFQEKQWANGSYSNMILNRPGEILIDLGEQLTVGATLTITPQGSANWVWNPANSSENTVWYVNNLANVSYSAWDTILKEQIVLYQPVRVIAWQINLSVKPQTLQITTEGNDYLIKDPAGTEEWIRIPMPFVIDANGVKRTLRYSWNNGQKRLTLTQDFGGLVYPLTIDPTYTVDSSGSVGWRPQMMVNVSGYPMIAYIDRTNTKLKLATNNSGSWSNSILSTATMSYVYFPLGTTIDSANDLPFINHLRENSYQNITYFSGGNVITKYTEISSTILMVRQQFSFTWTAMVR